MSDLIRREDAIEAIERAVTKEAARWSIKELPSAQPERKRGEWIKHPEQKNIYGGKCVECSICKTKYVVQYIEDELFCRNCGAEMGGSDNGN